MNSTIEDNGTHFYGYSNHKRSVFISFSFAKLGYIRSLLLMKTTLMHGQTALCFVHSSYKCPLYNTIPLSNDNEKQRTDLPGTSLVPAAAVIPAPLAYTNVAGNLTSLPQSPGVNRPTGTSTLTRMVGAFKN